MNRAIKVALLILIVLNGFLLLKWRTLETDNAMYARMITRQLTVQVDNLKEKDEIKAALDKCNFNLALVQAKPVPVMPPAPACPEVPTVVCPPIPELTPISTPVPTKIVYKYLYLHRHHIHYRKPAVMNDCDTTNSFNPKP